MTTSYGQDLPGLHIGVVGAGTMGTGVAQCLAQSNHTVTVVDCTREALASADTAIKDGLRLQQLLGEKASDSLTAALDRLTWSTEWESLSTVKFVVECGPEQLPVKNTIFQSLESVCPDDAIFASNTSAIPVTQLASMTKRPGKVLGMHFMNPVTLKDTVEVIKGTHTNDQTIDTALKLLESMNKEGIIVADSPGFISNRVLMPTVNEAAFIVYEESAEADQVDKVFRSCLGHQMGPLETADLIGLDVIVDSLNVLYENYRDARFHPCPLLVQMVDDGYLGRKSGRGFYAYSSTKRTRTTG